METINLDKCDYYMNGAASLKSYKDTAHEAILKLLNQPDLPPGIHEAEMSALVRFIQPQEPKIRGVPGVLAKRDIDYVVNARVPSGDSRDYLRYPVYDPKAKRLMATNGHILSIVKEPKEYKRLRKFTRLDHRGHPFERDDFGRFPAVDKVIPTRTEEPREVTVTNDMVVHVTKEGKQVVKMPDGAHFELGLIFQASGQSRDMIYLGSGDHKFMSAAIIRHSENPQWESVVMPMKV